MTQIKKAGPEILALLRSKNDERYPLDKLGVNDYFEIKSCERGSLLAYMVRRQKQEPEMAKRKFSTLMKDKNCGSVVVIRTK